jgi:signal peptidase I
MNDFTADNGSNVQDREEQTELGFASAQNESLAENTGHSENKRAGSDVDTHRYDRYSEYANENDKFTGEYASRQERKQSVKNRDSSGGSFIGFLRELPALVLTAVVIAFLLKWLVIQPFYIPSESMEPTLVPDDRVLVSKFLYRFMPPKQTDIIVFVAPKGDGVDFIKRIVAVGGDEIEQKNGIVYVNGKSISGDFKTTPGDTFSFPKMKIAKDHVFVMGDNRTNSSDSRVFGPVPVSSIVGRAFVLYWPANRIRVLH